MQKGEDIDFIKSGPSMTSPATYTARTGVAAVIFASFAVNLLVLLKTSLWDRHIAASPLLENRRILARTLKRLARVRHGEDIAPLLETYFGEKSGLGLAEITDQKIAESFRRRQVPVPTASKNSCSSSRSPNWRGFRRTRNPRWN